MSVADVLARKGPDVAVVRSETTVPALLQLLAERGIGAAVVLGGDDVTGAGGLVGGAIVGMVSERDVVRRLAQVGAGLLAGTVGDLMTTTVHACAPGDEVDDVLNVMTSRRVRHIPVMAEGALVGLVSIGDLVKHRIDELQVERDHLTAYISG